MQKPCIHSFAVFIIYRLPAPQKRLLLRRDMLTTTMRLTLITITTRLIQACLMLKSRNCSTLTLKMNSLMDFWERIPLNNFEYSIFVCLIDCFFLIKYCTLSIASFSLFYNPVHLIVRCVQSMKIKSFEANF